jgi:hypothetical protein
MKKAQVILLMVFALLLVGGGLMVNRRSKVLDLSKDEHPFNSMLLPPRSVTADAFLDGGSVSISVVDRTGTTFHFAFPHKRSSVGSAFTQAFYGAEHSTEPGALPFKDPARAKEIGLLLLKTYGGFSDKSAVAMYYHLSETSPSTATKLFWRLRSIFK